LWWVVGAVTVAVILALGTWFVMDAAIDSVTAPAELARLKIDALRTALAVFAGALGLYAFYISVRRQSLSEREHNRQARVSEGLQRDAVERRITELYVRAAELLESDKVPVAIAGLYALERVGQLYPGASADGDAPALRVFAGGCVPTQN
jgi:hypothetical protein